MNRFSGKTKIRILTNRIIIITRPSPPTGNRESNIKSIESFPTLLTQFEQDIQAFDLETIRDKLLDLTYPCYRIQATSSIPSQSVTSHLAGLPDLPEGFSWPKDGDEYQTFLAQINLDELPKPRIGDLPDKGTLWLFLGADEPASDILHHVVFSETPKTELHPTPPPGETVFEDEREFSRLNLHFNLSYSLDETYMIKKLDPFYGEIGDLTYRIGQTSEISQILGYGRPVSGDPREEAYLVHCGKPRLIYHTHLKPADVQKKIVNALEDFNTRLAEYNKALLEDLDWYLNNMEKHADEIRKWRLLIQINSYLDAGMCWWDAGYLQFWIHEDDLARRDFSNTYCCLQTS